MEASTLDSLFQAGAAGLVIIVVVMFLKFLADERRNRTDEHNQMMTFIGEQRKENNASVATLSTAISTSLTGLTQAIENLRTSTLEHHQLTEDAVQEMRDKSRQRRKADS